MCVWCVLFSPSPTVSVSSGWHSSFTKCKCICAENQLWNSKLRIALKLSRDALHPVVRFLLEFQRVRVNTHKCSVQNPNIWMKFATDTPLIPMFHFSILFSMRHWPGWDPVDCRQMRIMKRQLCGLVSHWEQLFYSWHGPASNGLLWKIEELSVKTNRQSETTAHQSLLRHSGVVAASLGDIGFVVSV